MSSTRKMVAIILHRSQLSMNQKREIIREFQKEGKLRDSSCDHSFRGMGNRALFRQGIDASDTDPICLCEYSPCQHEARLMWHQERLQAHKERRFKKTRRLIFHGPWRDEPDVNHPEWNYCFYGNHWLNIEIDFVDGWPTCEYHRLIREAA